MSKACAKFRILVHLVNALASKEVKTIEVLLIRGEEQAALWVLY